MSEKSTNFLTTRQLARRWQVSEATIKRWADRGRLHPTRTLGGHRRFALTEVLRFQSEHGLDVDHAAREAKAAPALTAEPETFDENASASQFFDCIVAGHEAQASSVLLGAYMEGVPLLKILDVSVTQALRRVGDFWHSGEISVADEHLATRTATRAIETLRDCIRLEQRDERRAVCCAVEEELHEIAVLCVQVLLEEAGWSVRNLGANTPFYAIADAVEKHSPQLVCISSTANMALSRNAREYEQFRAAMKRLGARVVLGGEGFRQEAIRQRFPADLHAGSFSNLMEYLQTL